MWMWASVAAALMLSQGWLSVEGLNPISTTSLNGIVHNFFVYRSNLIFWIVMGCGIADFDRRGL